LREPIQDLTPRRRLGERQQMRDLARRQLPYIGPHERGALGRGSRGELRPDGLGRQRHAVPRQCRAMAAPTARSARDPLPLDGHRASHPSVMAAASRFSSTERPREAAMKISARNQLPAKVVAIASGEAIANVELDANGLRLVASITVEAVRELGLQEGTDVTAVVKASDVMLAIAD
jgi:molybdopterin-binding protein